MAFKPKANLPDFVQEVPGGAVGVGIGRSAKHGGKFGPAARVEKWGGRGWLEIQCLGSAPRKAVKVKSHPTKGEYLELECTKYGRDEIHSWKEGSTEWDITWPTLNDVPQEGYVDFALQMPANVASYHQPALTAWESETIEGPDGEWHQRYIRPDNIVNSYVFYGNRVGNIVGLDGQPLVSYETGKLLHWYRSKLIDSNASEVWIDQTLLSGNVMRIYLPSAWLNDAVFPVTLDPTLGYTTAGGSYFTHYAGSWAAIMARWPNTGDTMPSGGTLNSISYYVYANVPEGIMYATDYEYTGSNWDRRTTGSISWPAGGGWATITMSGNLTSGNKYAVGCFHWSSIFGVYAGYPYYDSGSNIDARSTSAAWADPWSEGSSSNSNLSAYLTYTATSGKAPPRPSYGRRPTRMFNLRRFG